MSSKNVIVIGGGLSGLMLTHRLHRMGHKVTLLEARDYLGGTLRRATLDFLTPSNENMSLLEWVRAEAPLPLQFEIIEHRPEIFDEARWKTFSGFLDAEFASISELGRFSHTHEVKLTPGIDQLVRALIEQLPIAAQLQAEVTEIKVSDERVTEVVVNGDKTIKADMVIFTGPPQNLNRLIPGEALPAKHRTRLAKFNSWTAITLELEHADIGHHSGLRLFNHSSKEFEPVIGRIEGTTSRWLTLAHHERNEDHEFIGQCIRHIKRQLKRAWPDLLSDQPKEKIYVDANAFGQNSLKTKSPWQIPEISNLYLAHHSLATQGGALGALEAVQGAEHSLGVWPSSPAHNPSL